MKRQDKICPVCGKLFGKRWKESWKQFSLKKTCGMDCGRKIMNTKERGEAISRAKKGKPNYTQRGERNNNWKGGKTTLVRMIRVMFEYKYWRKQVFERDNYKCIMCGLHSGNGKAVILNADHIKPFAVILLENNIKTLDEARYCKELWDINNGRTLCNECHRNTDTYANRLNIKSFLR